MKHKQHSEFFNHSKLPVILLWLALIAFIFVLVTLIFNAVTTMKIAGDFDVDPTPHELVVVEECPIYCSAPVYEVFDAWIGTPLEPAMEYCSSAAWYYGVPSEVFVGISFAESTFKKFPEGSHNPFGIMSGRGIKQFKSWHHSCNYFASLIKNYYIGEGLDTPEKIYPVYVNFDNPNWLKAVRQYWSPEFCESSLKC